MNARKYIGWCITVMDFLYQIAENVFVRIYLHPQICAIRIKRADHHADGHADKQKSTQPVIIRFTGKEEIQHRTGYIKKPDDVGNDKVLAKWNHVIQRHMHDLIIVCDHTLQPEKIRKVEKDVPTDPDVSIFF